MRALTFIVFFLSFFSSEAQKYRFHQYRVAQGLPSDVMKAVTQDSLGFFWIATDDGVAKYDGIKFTIYKKALRSQYSKGFLKTRDGRLLLFGDMDVIEIQNKVDTVVFKSVLRGERFVTDSTLWFPKSIYQDKADNIWFGEPKSVVRYDGKRLRRFVFEEKNRSTVFIRSFSFFEDAVGNLFTISYNGYVFWYDKENDVFTELKDVKLPPDVSHAVFYKNRLWLACRDGLFTAKVENNKVTNVLPYFVLRNVSHILPTSDSSLLIATYNDDLFKISPDEPSRRESIYTRYNGINHCYISNEGDIWASTDKGLFLIQRNLFTIADEYSQIHFIEGMAFDEPNETVYYCNKESVVKLTFDQYGDPIRKVIDNNSTHYFQTLQYNKNGLWAASVGNVLLYRNDKLFKSWDFFDQGNFVHDLFLDSKNNIWLSQAGNTVINGITDSLNVVTFPVDGLENNESMLFEKARKVYMQLRAIRLNTCTLNRTRKMYSRILVRL